MVSWLKMLKARDLYRKLQKGNYFASKVMQIATRNFWIIRRGWKQSRNIISCVLRWLKLRQNISRLKSKEAKKGKNSSGQETKKRQGGHDRVKEEKWAVASLNHNFAGIHFKSQDERTGRPHFRDTEIVEGSISQRNLHLLLQHAKTWDQRLAKEWACCFIFGQVDICTCQWYYW